MGSIIETSNVEPRNQLSGPIPEEIGGMESLQILILKHNELTGPIPESLGTLKLLKLNVNTNDMNGPIPFLGNLPPQARVNISRNRYLYFEEGDSPDWWNIRGPNWKCEGCGHRLPMPKRPVQ